MPGGGWGRRVGGGRGAAQRVHSSIAALREPTAALAPRPQTLLESGAKVNTSDVDGWLPLHVAAYYGAAEITDMLLRAGAVVRPGAGTAW